VAAEHPIWQGRTDTEDGAAGHRWHQVVQVGSQLASPGIAIVGLASDLGVRINKGRPGAIEGPGALRAALANLAWHHDLPVLDAGDIGTGNQLDEAQDAFASRTARQLDAGHFVLGLGGGHELGWASYQGCRRHLDRRDATLQLGIINFDAHFDLRLPAPAASSGTPFYQVAEDCRDRGQAFHYCCLGIATSANTRALYERAEALGVHYLPDLDCRDELAHGLLERFLARVDALYLTVCLDAFAAAHAPGVSAPASPGIEPAWTLRTIGLIGQLCQRLNVQWLMADVAELSPALDHDRRTARLGARILDTCVAARWQ
jgi:formiminoglutamase